MDKEEFVNLIMDSNITLKGFIDGDRVELTIKYYGVPTLIEVCRRKGWELRSIFPELLLFSILFLGDK